MSAQDGAWKAREQGEEARYAKAKEQEQLAALRAKMQTENGNKARTGDLGIEGGFGGQESLEDRYATTSGDH
ncbi:IATP domain-containing protein [Ceratobasidium sp. AG-Ba]|nr:IATP domain-containing protein [Ceratobasidium sp. AG-Ba]QRW12931.1 IATP domain-containing protein [Ceratobasidium sp. AG-Ba]